MTLGQWLLAGFFILVVAGVVVWVNAWLKSRNDNGR